MGDEFYLRYYVGHKGKFGHEFLEFEFQPDGKLRYANNSNYKNDTIIRKEVFVTHPVLDELKRIVLDSEILKEDDSNWPEPDRVGRQELEIHIGKEHISFATTKLGSLLQVQSSKDPEGLRVFYYLVQHVPPWASHEIPAIKRVSSARIVQDPGIVQILVEFEPFYPVHGATMEREQALETFGALTNAPRHVAEHVLDAHAGDLDAAVNFYLEGGGVGHGTEAAAAHSWDQPPRSVPLQDMDDDAWEIAEGSLLAGPALDNDADEPASNMAVHEPATRPPLSPALRRSRRSHAASGSATRILEDVGAFGLESTSGGDEDGSDEEEAMPSTAPVGRRRRAQRRAARKARPIVDDDSDNAVDLAWSSSEEEQGVGAAATNRNDGGPEWMQRTSLGNNDEGETAQQDIAAAAGLSEVDLEEQKMLLAAYTGEAYEGRPRVFAPPELSPRAVERAALRSEQDEAYEASLAADRAKAAAAAAEVAAREEAAAREESAKRERERALDERTAKLPVEPSSGGVRLLVRLPDGSRLDRRFDPGNSTRSLFDFVDVSCRDKAGAPEPESYRLVAQFPRRVLEPGSNIRLADAGFSSGQDMLLLEPPV